MISRSIDLQDKPTAFERITNEMTTPVEVELCQVVVCWTIDIMAIKVDNGFAVPLIPASMPSVARYVSASKSPVYGINSSIESPVLTLKSLIVQQI